VRRPIDNPILDVSGSFPPVIINPYSFAAAAAFSPLDISGCVLWLKADGDVYNTGTTQATDGQTVTTWKDASGNGRDAVHGLGPKATFETNYVNTLPAIVANTQSGSCEYTFPLPTLTAGTMFVATYFAGSGGAAFKVGGAGVDADQTFYPYYDTGAIAFGTTVRKWVADSNNRSRWIVWTCSASSTWLLHRDGVLKHTEANTFSAPNTTGNVIYIGTDGANVTNLAEVLIYDTALSTANREAVEDYLGAKYGITITH
jgi:hypothetical protein